AQLGRPALGDRVERALRRAMAIRLSGAILRHLGGRRCVLLRRRRELAVTIRAGAALGAALLLAACGGDTGERPTAGRHGLPLGCGPILPLSTDPDPGSGPVDCTALDAYELSSNPVDPTDVPKWRGDDFETGAGSSWYTNNDRTAMQTPPPDVDPVKGELIP